MSDDELRVKRPHERLRELVEGVAEQQAMPDDSYKDPLDALVDEVEELDRLQIEVARRREALEQRRRLAVVSWPVMFGDSTPKNIDQLVGEIDAQMLGGEVIVVDADGKAWTVEVTGVKLKPTP